MHLKELGKERVVRKIKVECNLLNVLVRIFKFCNDVFNGIAVDKRKSILATYLFDNG